MKYFISETDLTRVSFEGGQWVDISTDQTQADSDYIMNKMISTKVDSKKPEISMEMGRLPLLERRIKAWSFDNDENEPMPITVDSISRLRSQYREKVLSEIDRLSKTSFLPLKEST